MISADTTAKLLTGEYIQLEANKDDIVCSQVFPGLWLAKSALLSGNLAQVLTTFQQGLSIVEHQEFIQKLASLSGR